MADEIVVSIAHWIELTKELKEAFSKYDTHSEAQRATFISALRSYANFSNKLNEQIKNCNGA